MKNFSKKDLDILNSLKHPILKEGQKRIDIEYFIADFETDILKVGGLCNHKSFDKEIPFEIFEKWMLANYKELVLLYNTRDVYECEGYYKDIKVISWHDLMNDLDTPLQKEFLQTILK